MTARRDPEPVEAEFRPLPAVPNERTHTYLSAPVALVNRDPEGKPWDLMQGESSSWFSRFDIYRSIGPNRSMAKAYEVYQRREAERAERPFVPTPSKLVGGTPGQGSHRSAPTNWWQASRRWRWAERAAAWDAASVEVARAAEVAEVVKARQSQVVAGKAARGVALKALQHYDRNPKLVKPSEAALLLKVGDDLVSAGLGLDDAAKAPGQTLHVKVIDLGDDGDDQLSLPQPATRTAPAPER